MKQVHFFILSLLITIQVKAQIPNSVYGIVRKNYYSTVTDPFDSTITYQQFDSCTIRLGNTNPAMGYVSNLGNVTYTQAVNLTGAALNPYNNSYIFLGGYGINTFDINTGNLLNQVPMNNPLGFSYFDNFRFNNSDSTIYGLSRRNYLDSTTGNMQAGLFLATANPQTGLISEISQQAVAQGFSLSGSAIDPYQMVYYFSSGNNLMGLDMYNGTIYSNVNLTITDGFAFGNFTYSCADTALYGLVRQNYFSWVPDPINMGDSIQVLDSATLKLGRVNPNTGIVTNISPYALAQGGYTINGGAAIDPNNMIYYFSTGSAVVGVSLITGLVTSTSNYSFADGDYFDLMRNFENCISSVQVRLNPTSANVLQTKKAAAWRIYPNPSNGQFTVLQPSNLANITVTDVFGKQILNTTTTQQATQLQINNTGIYFVTVTDANGTSTNKIIVSK